MTCVIGQLHMRHTCKCMICNFYHNLRCIIRMFRIVAVVSKPLEFKIPAWMLNRRKKL